MGRLVKVNDKLPSFKLHLHAVMFDVMNEIAGAILEDATNMAPLKDGGLRSDKDIENLQPLKRRINFNIEYAGAQEAGGTRDRTYIHYTTAGTGAHFLERAGDKYAQITIKGTFRKHSKRIRA